MRGSGLWLWGLPLTVGCFVRTLPEDGTLCGADGTGSTYSCPIPGYSCVIEAADAGSQLACLLPGDGGGCPSTCGAGSICDQAFQVCVPTATCASALDCNGGDLCQSQVCVAPSQAVVDSCSVPAYAPGLYSLSGGLAWFSASPDINNFVCAGTTINFYDDDGGQHAAQCGPDALGYPSYSIDNLPGGTYMAVVDPAGGIPTYFPGIQVGPGLPGDAGIRLWSVVQAAPDQQVFGNAFAPTPGHIVWVGRILSCDGQDYVNNFTVGLSASETPATLIVGQDGGGLGEFFAMDGPYSPTTYVVETSAATPLLSGTFIPPQPFDGGPIAVALIYPTWALPGEAQ